MMPGGRGMNPRMMQQMMKQLGITVDELDEVERVIIETKTKDLVFTKPSVSCMKAQGQATWQVVGEHQELPKGQAGKAGPAGTAVSAAPASKATAPPEAPKPLFTDEDVRMVMQGAGVDRGKATKALEECEGEVAAAIIQLTEET